MAERDHSRLASQQYAIKDSHSTLSIKPAYDVVIVGGGHNGLVAAAYLARAGKTVLVLERNSQLGGATRSARSFAGLDVRLSVYSYLVSLFPRKILNDLDLTVQLRSRSIASYTPSFDQGVFRELLVSNQSTGRTRESFLQFPGGAEDYQGYQRLIQLQHSLAQKLWPTLLHPLQSRDALKRSLNQEEQLAWDALIENPLGNIIESSVSNDLIRGMLFTDAKIGVSTYPLDPSLLQNKTYLYHIIGQGTGEWRVPVGGMGSLTHGLEQCARQAGCTFVTDALVQQLNPDSKRVHIQFRHGDRLAEVDARHALVNASTQELERLIGKPRSPLRPIDEGSVVKINMVLRRLPRIRSERVSSEEAFTGTFHLDEGYGSMSESFKLAQADKLPEKLGGEMYCHSLTDPSILSDALNREGYQTLTLFGLDMPYSLFETNNASMRSTVLNRYLKGINQYTEDPIEDCLALDEENQPCIEIKTPVDLEQEIHLPRGNIFHNALTWPFVEDSDETGTWGVETSHPRILICGSGARRGGAVSGIPGHNAAHKILCLDSTNSSHPKVKTS